MTIENAKKNAPAVFGPATETLAEPSAVATIAPYRTLNQIVRGLIAAFNMLIWGTALVIGIFLLQPNTSQLSGILMVLAVPLLFVAALPIVYRHWVKNWRSF